MEPVTVAVIAASAVKALVPFFNKGAEKLVDKSAEEVFNKRGEIWNKVKGLFAEDELTTLKLFENDPENVETQAELRGELKQILKSNPEVVDELDKLVNHLKEFEKNLPTAKNVSTIENKDISNSFIINDVNQS